MNQTFLALRAIGSEFAWRLYLPVVIITGIVMALSIALSIWLTTLNGWWGILFALIIIAVLIVAVILVIVGILVRAIRPRQSKTQTTSIKKFVDTVQSLAEVSGTPKFVILFYIVRDMASKNKNGYVRKISSETLSMQHDFRDICDGFAIKNTRV